MKLIKKQVDDNSRETVITLEYSTWTEELEAIAAFIEGKKETIQGIGENKEIYNIKLSRILYFEAVGEHVFAYTKDHVFEIRQRLYQVEELVRPNSIFRASKSVLVNIRKISVLKPALNGRLFATLTNGESILVSRAYAKDIMQYIRSA